MGMGHHISITLTYPPYCTPYLKGANLSASSKMHLAFSAHRCCIREQIGQHIERPHSHLSLTNPPFTHHHIASIPSGKVLCLLPVGWVMKAHASDQP